MSSPMPSSDTSTAAMAGDFQSPSDRTAGRKPQTALDQYGRLIVVTDKSPSQRGELTTRLGGRPGIYTPTLESPHAQTYQEISQRLHSKYPSLWNVERQVQRDGRPNFPLLKAFEPVRQASSGYGARLSGELASLAVLWASERTLQAAVSASEHVEGAEQVLSEFKRAYPKLDESFTGMFTNKDQAKEAARTIANGTIVSMGYTGAIRNMPTILRRHLPYMAQEHTRRYMGSQEPVEEPDSPQDESIPWLIHSIQANISEQMSAGDM